MNAAGSGDSPIISVALAAVPNKPSSGPSSINGRTNTTVIGVTYTALTAAQNGGAVIQSYEL